MEMIFFQRWVNVWPTRLHLLCACISENIMHDVAFPILIYIILRSYSPLPRDKQTQLSAKMTALVRARATLQFAWGSRVGSAELSASRKLHWNNSATRWHNYFAQRVGNRACANKLVNKASGVSSKMGSRACGQTGLSLSPRYLVGDGEQRERARGICVAATTCNLPRRRDRDTTLRVVLTCDRDSPASSLPPSFSLLLSCARADDVCFLACAPVADILATNSELTIHARVQHREGKVDPRIAHFCVSLSSLLHLADCSLE